MIDKKSRGGGGDFEGRKEIYSLRRPQEHFLSLYLVDKGKKVS